MTDTPDFRLRDEGSVSLLWAVTPAAREWVEEHIPADSIRWASAVVIEARYVPDIEAGIAADGLVIGAALA